MSPASGPLAPDEAGRGETPKLECGALFTGRGIGWYRCERTPGHSGGHARWTLNEQPAAPEDARFARIVEALEAAQADPENPNG